MTDLSELMGERWNAEAAAAAPHAGEMLTYLRGLLVEPSNPGIRRCAQKLIDQIEEAARAKDPILTIPYPHPECDDIHQFRPPLNLGVSRDRPKRKAKKPGELSGDFAK